MSMEEQPDKAPPQGLAEYTVIEWSKTKDVPKKEGTNYGPSKVIALKLGYDHGDDGGKVVYTAEWFTAANTQNPPDPGGKITGEITPGDYGPKFSKKAKGSGGGGGFGKSPAEQKRIQRQHSQEMALRHQAACVACGARPWSLEQIREMTDWFLADIDGKAPPITWDPMQTDVPADTSDFDPTADPA